MFWVTLVVTLTTLGWIAVRCRNNRRRAVTPGDIALALERGRQRAAPRHDLRDAVRARRVEVESS